MAAVRPPPSVAKRNPSTFREAAMQGHEWVDGWCRHCGAHEVGHAMTLEEGHTSTCVERPASRNDAPRAVSLMPQPGSAACEDADIITARLAELAHERQEALNRADIE